MKIRRIDFYPDDWLVGTSRLNALEVAVYITVCALQYSEGGPIERDDRDLARRLKLRIDHVTRTVDALKRARKLHETDSKLYCNRCVEELKRAQKRHEDASNSASKRWNNNNLADATASGSAYPRARDNHQSSNNNQQTRASRPASLGNGGEPIARSATNHPAPTPDEINHVHNLVNGAIRRIPIDTPDPTPEQRNQLIAQWNKELGLEQ